MKLIPINFKQFESGNVKDGNIATLRWKPVPDRLIYTLWTSLVTFNNLKGPSRFCTRKAGPNKLSYLKLSCNQSFNLSNIISPFSTSIPLPYFDFPNFNVEPVLKKRVKTSRANMHCILALFFT